MFPKQLGVNCYYHCPATTDALVVLATIHPRVYGKNEGCARG